MSVNYSEKENKNPLNVFKSFCTSIGEKGATKGEFHHSVMLKVIKVLFHFDNNPGESLRRSLFEKT